MAVEPTLARMRNHFPALCEVTSHLALTGSDSVPEGHIIAGTVPTPAPFGTGSALTISDDFSSRRTSNPQVMGN